VAQSKAACPAMAKYLIPILALAASALADDAAHNAGAYAAPPAYSPPVDNYATPDAYGPPAQDSYGAPDPYNPAPTYEDNSYAPQDSYGAVADCRTTGTCGDDLFDLSKITELLPLFLAVFAAIIVAQLFAPLIGMLFGAKLGLAAGILGPLAAIPVAIIQAVLLPFNLQICTIDPTGVNPPAIKVRSFGSRSLDADMVDTLATVVLNAISAYEQ